MFLRDAKQAEVLLSQQENFLAKEETPSSLEQAEHAVRQYAEDDTHLSVLIIAGETPPRLPDHNGRKRRQNQGGC